MNERADMKSDIGSYRRLVEALTAGRKRPLAYNRERGEEFERWKSLARAKLHELLGYGPAPCPLEPETVSTVERDGLLREEVEYTAAGGVRTRAVLLLPAGAKGPLPGVAALHDHGGFYFYGREKIADEKPEREILRQFQDRYYGGKAWAAELARRGFAVLCPDAPFFGSLRPVPEEIDDEILERFDFSGELPPRDSDAYIERFNEFCHRYEALFVKHLLAAGTTWPGAMFGFDGRAVDYLASRPEVDADRLGCCGLSLGGYRSVHLAALDPRIRCAVAAGWMTTYDSLQENLLRSHTFMLYVPRIASYLDLPDIAGLTAPGAFFVQQCAQDDLFTKSGMEAACLRIESIYRGAGFEDRYRYRFYDNPHQFNAEMQEDAFEWLVGWLTR